MTEAPRLSGCAKDRARRDLLVMAGVVTAGVATACAKPVPVGDSRAAAAAAPITWRVQTHIGGATNSYNNFKRFCARVGELSQGKLVLEPYPPGAIVGAFDMFEALKKGLLDCASVPPHYPADKIPELAFLSSYPLGLDRPDQWETWFFELGGLDLARKMHEPHNIQFVGPIQHDLNIIHSKVPIRSFADFKGKRLRMPGGLIADVFDRAGAKTVLIAPDQIYGALANGSIDAADFVGPAVNYELGFANVAKYIILGPPSTPSIHQPCDLNCVLVNRDKWSALPKHLRDVVEYAVRWYSWEHYGSIQRANTLSWAKYKQRGVEILRLSDSDVSAFRDLAIPVWFQWAKKSPLGRQALASQLAYMRSPAVGYVNEGTLTDMDGKRLSLDD
ncbi:MAG: TRAP transporter substrate-binding protein DctP [Myxococcota bacterium]|nr:TRAP transporter substrate-binding protein DctP [Myxococcota bacterium]